VLCHDTLPSESLIDETVIEDEDKNVTIQTTITSFELAVVAVIVKEDPEAHVPVALPSSERVPDVGFGILD